MTISALVAFFKQEDVSFFGASFSKDRVCTLSIGGVHIQFRTLEELEAVEDVLVRCREYLTNLPSESGQVPLPLVSEPMLGVSSESSENDRGKYISLDIEISDTDSKI